MRPSLDLFADIDANRHGFLDVGGGHRLYWEESGRLDGPAVLFVHGGPGAGAGVVHRRFFDPDHWRIIIFDQRGAGRSQPFATTRDNTTAHLVDDMERLRRHLGIERWLLFGGSWGATLALVYAVRHPQRCRGLVLRGVFLARRREADWFLNGMGLFFPEAWRAFTGFLSDDERASPAAAYRRRLEDPDPAVHLPAAASWSAYENACSRLMPAGDDVPGASTALALARIEVHYFAHDMFLPENYILDNVAALKPVPGIIVQGRYDMVCPPASAEALSRAWPASELVMIPDAGHSAFEPGIRTSLVAAVERFKRIP